MNSKYIYTDGKTVIVDHNDKYISTECYNNLEDILVQENVIENINLKIVELEKQANKKIVNKKNYFLTTLTLIFTTISSFMLSVFMGCLIFKESFLINLINLKIITITPDFIAFIIFTLLGMIVQSNNYKRILKTKKGINSQLEFLKKQLILEKQKLDELQAKKIIMKKNTQFEVVEINDKEQLETLKNYLNLYYNFGYNSEKYYKYYEQGVLEEKLKNQCTSKEINLAKEYLEEKGKTLKLEKQKTKLTK